MSVLAGKPWGVRSKVWLELNGEPVMGEGRLAILEAIDRYGSILSAAQETQVSYRKIRGAIRDMERIVGHRLVRTYRGGGQGGGADLTDIAHDLMSRFKRQIEGVQESIDIRFKDLVG